MKRILQHIAILLMIFLGLQATSQESTKNLYSFGGHAFVEQFPLDFCVAQLFDVNDPYTPIATVEFDTLGYYFFYKIPEGEYFVMAGPGSDDPFFGQYSFTFYPESLEPNKADTIFLTEDNWEYDIDLVILDPFNSVGGNGQISGNITYIETLKDYDFSNVNLLLLDAEMNPQMHLQADADGHFLLKE